MVREGRVFISTATDPQFGSGYLITAYEPGAQVASGSSGTAVTVRAGHGVAAGDYVMVCSSSSCDTARIKEVLSVGATTVNVASAFTVAAGEFLFNLGPDSVVPDYQDSGAVVYTDMDYTTVALYSTVMADATGRYRYFHKGIAIWELVRTSEGAPIAIYTNAASDTLGVDSSTDNAVARWDGATGEELQNSVVIIGDAGEVSGVTTLAVSGTSTLAAVNASGLVAAAGAVTVGTTLGVTGASTLAAVSATTVNASGLVAAAAAMTVGTTLDVTGAATAASVTTPILATTGNSTLGDASTDTTTNVGRLIVRTIGVDPTSVATAGTIGEVVYSSSTAKFYGKHTGTATDTNWRLLGT